MQPRSLSALEAVANVVMGLGLSFFLQLALFEAMGIAATIGQSVMLTLAFSGLSLVRAYVLRRLFNRFSIETPGLNKARSVDSLP